MASLFCAPGPSLPRFSTLLIKGTYPPSSPIHLCISHLKTSSHGRALFLTPSREALAAALEEYNDGWMGEHCMTGAFAALFSRIDMFYPPTAKHWLLLLSLFRPLENASNTPHNIAMLSHTLSIIVLHELSYYFLPSDSQQQHAHADLSQYLHLVIAALSLSSFLSAPGEAIPVVLFDSRLHELWLPIVRPVSPSRRLVSDEDSHPVRKEFVERFVEKYFEWAGTVSDLKGENSPRTPPLHGTFDALHIRSGMYKLKLKNRLAEDQQPIIWEWSESRKSKKSHSTRTQTYFEFYENSS